MGAASVIEKMFRRRRTAHAPAAPDASVAAVVVGDGPWPHERRAEAWKALRRIVAEALIVQDIAEELLIELRDERDLAAVAPRCGALMSRFVALGNALPWCGDPVMERHTATLRAIFDHHMLMLNSARALLAAEWRSERLTAQLDRIDGLGAPARRLEAVRAAILAHSDWFVEA